MKKWTRKIIRAAKYIALFGRVCNGIKWMFIILGVAYTYLNS